MNSTWIHHGFDWLEEKPAGRLVAVGTPELQGGWLYQRFIDPDAHRLFERRREPRPRALSVRDREGHPVVTLTNPRPGQTGLQQRVERWTELDPALYGWPGPEQGALL